MTRNNLMTPRIVVCGVLVALASIGVTSAQPQLDPVRIVDRMLNLYRGESGQAKVTMEIVTERGTQVKKLRIRWRGLEEDSESCALVEIVSPDEGVATLRDGADGLWHYLPNIDRTIRVPNAMLGWSWAGSHATYHDLLGGELGVEDYDISVSNTRSPERTTLNLEPKEGVALVWGSISFEVRTADSLPTSGHYYDEAGAIVRSFEFRELETVQERTFPRVKEIRWSDRPDERTTIRYDQIEFGIRFEESAFSLPTGQSCGS